MPSILGLTSAKITSVPSNRVERKITPHGGGNLRGSGVGIGTSKKKETGKDKERKRSRSKVDEGESGGDRPVKKMRRQSSLIKQVVSVLKVNPTEFPKELHDGKDIDPAEAGDYDRCFVPLDSSVPDQPFVAEQKYQDIIPLPLMAQTNVEYCIVCNEVKDGGDHLTRCVQCPRSYHADCLAKVGGDAEGDKCHGCKRDRQEEDDDFGKDPPLNPHIRERYGKSFAYEAKLMDLIIAIVDKLKDYDFGDVFADPVDPETVPGYLDVISYPMDYGTVIQKLEGGVYPNTGVSFTEEMNVIETVLLHALCDVEQVHHNCMVYNQKGSCFYRIGQVHSVKWKSFYKKHIADRLSDNVKANLEEFRARCKIEQGKQVRALSGMKVGNRNFNAIGIFDPDTMRVVKQYTSKSAAKRAAAALKEAGYDCEFDNVESNGKAIIDKITSNESTSLLFGYRWIPMDRLRSGNFVLEKQANGSGGNEVIWKEDSVSGQKLVGFDTEEAAYKDWLEARSTAIASIDPSIGEDLASFQQHFVDGVNTINGVAWKRFAAAKTEDQSTKEQEDAVTMEKESVSQPLEGAAMEEDTKNASED